MEAVDKIHIKNIDIHSNIKTSHFIFDPLYSSKTQGTLKVDIVFKNKNISSSTHSTTNKNFRIKIKNPKLWSIGKPNLYDFTFTLLNNEINIHDVVKSYGGMRSIEIKKNKIYLNNKPLYQRLVLDQGFYPKGIWTAPTDKDLKNDILLSMKAGFNGSA